MNTDNMGSINQWIFYFFLFTFLDILYNIASLLLILDWQRLFRTYSSYINNVHYRLSYKTYSDIIKEYGRPVFRSSHYNIIFQCEICTQRTFLWKTICYL